MDMPVAKGSKMQKWTPDELEELKATMPQDGFGSFAFAEDFGNRHGRSKQSVLNRMMRIRGIGVYVPEKPRAECVDRNCLKCRRHFRAEGRYTRLCNDCKELDVFRSPDTCGVLMAARTRGMMRNADWHGSAYDPA
jgi:hypothetical protein